jgi:hypothetical protein
MDIPSQFEEVNQEENLENDEKPPDSGGILFNRKCFLKISLGVASKLFYRLQLFIFLYLNIEFQAECNYAFCY